MKQRKIIKYISGFLGCVLLAGGISVLPAQAGASNIVVDSSSFETTLDNSLWNSADNDVLVENSVLVFPKESTDTTSLIAKTNAKNSEYSDELVSAEATMNLKGIPNEETFVFALGLASLEAEMEEPGNVEIHFTNNEGVKASVVVYDLEGEKMVMVEPVSCGAGESVKVKATISSERVLNVSINGKPICNAELPVSGEGRVGFLQTGSCEVKVMDVRIVTHEYDRPENCDIYEDFENAAINKNLLTSKVVIASSGYVEQGAFIDEIDGNRAFRFKNSGVTYLGTLYQYSNFELTFDMVYLQRTAVKDEEGNVISPANANFAISFGDEAADYKGYGYNTSTDLLIFEKGSGVRSLNTGVSGSAKDKGYPICASDCNKKFSVRVSMIDSVVTVGVKWIEETEFTEILRYQVSERTPLGYVHLWTTSAPANFAIDNLSIVNKDEDANLIEVEYESAQLQKPEDFDYEPLQYMYEEKVSKGEKEFNPYLFIPIVGILCVVVFATTFVITKRRRGGDTDAKK